PLRRRDLDGKADRLEHLPSRADVERDDRNLAGGDVEPPDLAAGPEDEGLRIRRPRHVRIDAVDRPGLLEVAIQAVPDRPDLARAGIGDVQHALAPDPPDERERLAIGRGGRPDRAAGTGEEGLGLAGLPVEAVDDVDLAVRILVVVEGVARGVVLAV